MKKQTFTKQAVWQAAAVGVLAVGGVLFCLSGQIGIGQTYRQVRVDDRIIGYAPENTDMDGETGTDAKDRGENQRRSRMEQ